MAYQYESLNNGEEHPQASQYAMMLHGAHEAGKNISLIIDSRIKTDLGLRH
jgi:hypothetical protein